MPKSFTSSSPRLNKRPGSQLGQYMFRSLCLTLATGAFFYTYVIQDFTYISSHFTASHQSRDLETILPLPVSTGAVLPNQIQPSLPTCKSLMASKTSPYRDGSFLTRYTTPISWVPRVDGSRELRHSMCTLHRYTQREALQCLSKKHINMIGDSLTRYLFLNLAYFLHKGKYPPRFGKMDPCPYVNEHNQTVCSPRDEPNICNEKDWMTTEKDAWTRLMQAIGDKDSGLFGGYMESNAIRKERDYPFEKIVENYFYASPFEKGLYMSYLNEIGWADKPTPIHGFKFSGCAFHGDCSYSDELAQQRLKRAMDKNFDFEEPLEKAVAEGGVLRQILPPVDIVIYNRGLWGKVDPQRAEKLFPLLHKYSKADKGRCYWRTTTGRFLGNLQHERTSTKPLALRGGCAYLDVAHLVQDFNNIGLEFYALADQKYGNLNAERKSVWWDDAHFQPWVYEELNNMMLNVLCNNA